MSDEHADMTAPETESHEAASVDEVATAEPDQAGEAIDTAVATTGTYGRDLDADGTAESDADDGVAASHQADDTLADDELRDEDGSIADDVTAAPDGSLSVEDDADAAGESGDSEDAADAEPADEKDWYVLKVASNRERTVKKALERQIKRENLEEFFGDVVIPTQKVKETKNGKVVEREEKIWPGYIVVNMAINDDSWYLVRSVSGIGDFAGKAGEPSPMPPEEVDRLLGRKVEAAPGEEKVEEVVKINIPFSVGDRVKVNETSLAGSEGDVTEIDPETGQVKVTIQFLGQPTDVDFEHWQLEKV